MFCREKDYFYITCNGCIQSLYSFSWVTSRFIPFREVLMRKVQHSEESIKMLHRSIFAIDTLIVNGEWCVRNVLVWNE